MYVFIDQQRMPGVQPIFTFRDIESLEETRFHVAFHRDLGHHIDGFGYAADLGGAMEVVEE